ncbi:BMP family ABC transporter substrate-binding protein [Devosia psychrophila]|uniref:Basic membrane protein A n=1 Tax=Devosia psychrophila TaxID=728005 RepID=A0A0F5PU73_9HYPH|nr:BMP family ABC transporter substrate-binding protein [Devosia psychrophila]KKC32247.1 lipoprotein [Devosia psychrophila]SFD33622.1 basic membrane protein A [Devosia psychrophila]
MILWKSLLAGTALGLFGVVGATQAQDKLFVYVSPDVIGVNAFLKMGQTGTEAAAAKFGAEAKTFESSNAASRKENVEAAINEGASIIVMAGFEFNDIVTELAPAVPDTQFLIVDQCIENRPDNVHCAVFREHEATYLIGVAAGMLTKSNKVGVVSALDIPFLHRYTDGYAAGAKAQNPAVAVDIRWVGGENPFADPVRAKEQALAASAAGSDVIFTATSGGDFGVFEAAKEADFKAFAVDVNLCPEDPEHMVSGTLKRVDNAILQAVEGIEAGEKQLMLSLGLKEKGMSIIGLEDEGLAESKCLIASMPDVLAQVREVAAQIEDGSLTVEDPMFAK